MGIDANAFLGWGVVIDSYNDDTEEWYEVAEVAYQASCLEEGIEIEYGGHSEAAPFLLICIAESLHKGPDYSYLEIDTLQGTPTLGSTWHQRIKDFLEKNNISLVDKEPKWILGVYYG